MSISLAELTELSPITSCEYIDHVLFKFYYVVESRRLGVSKNINGCELLV